MGTAPGGERRRRPSIDVGNQVSFIGEYFPPVLSVVLPFVPPQIIISFPVQIAVWLSLAEGTFVPVEVDNQESATGL